MAAAICLAVFHSLLLSSQHESEVPNLKKKKKIFFELSQELTSYLDFPEGRILSASLCSYWVQMIGRDGWMASLTQWT